MASRSGRFLRSVAELWFPTVCARCGASGSSPCSGCLDDLVPAEPLEVIEPLSDLVALLRYDEVSRPFVADLKYRRSWTTVDALSPALSMLLLDVADVYPNLRLTWAPTTADRVRQRGFDQAEVLATRLGRDSEIAVERLLRRLPGAHQTGRSRGDRAMGINFVALGPVSGPVVVVDDVVTTGATLIAAARQLRAGGASDVIGFALAATPFRVPEGS